MQIVTYTINVYFTLENALVSREKLNIEDTNGRKIFFVNLTV